MLLVSDVFLDVKYKAWIDADRPTFHKDNNCIEIIQPWLRDGLLRIGKQSFSLEAGTVFIIDHEKNPVYKYEFTRSSRITQSKILMTRIGFSQIIHLCNFKLPDKFFEQGCFSYKINSKNPASFKTDAFFKTISENFDNPEKSDASEIVVSFINLLSLILLKNDKIQKHPEKTLKTFNLIAESLDKRIDSCEEISLDLICGELHLSKPYACRVFKQNSGMTIMQYASKARLSKAKTLLVETSLKIYEISEMLFFENSTAFCKSFKKSTAMSPQEYRNLHSKLNSSKKTLDF